MLDPLTCERARLARDARFDGLFFTGVHSTGVFCRPVCPAPQPKRRNVTYFPTAAAAVSAGLRPCRRCRPEAAPGTPAWNGTSATVSRAIQLIRHGALDKGGVDALAARLGVGARHLRRLFNQHVGVTPVAMANLQRVFFARQLLAETRFTITEIASASGFGSIRRFNAAFKSIFDHSPTAFRRTLPHGSSPGPAAGIRCTLSLPYRPPYQWECLLAFFRDRAIANVEKVDRQSYRRTIRTKAVRGSMRVRHADAGHALVLEIELSDIRGLIPVVERVRRMFDLDADRQAIADTLVLDEQIKPIVERLPGLPLAGSWDPFETAVRAIVGQQISVKAARTVLSRIVARCEPPSVKNNADELIRFFPTAEALSAAELTNVGMTGKRVATLKYFAQGVAAGDIQLAIGTERSEFVRRMVSLPGIGPWTAQYIAMRALSDPDAFPAGDLGIAQALSSNGKRPTYKQIVTRAENWRPWRAYAATYLWNA